MSEEKSGNALMLPSVTAFATPVTLEDLDAAAESFASSARASATRKAYRLDLKAFLLWCQQAGLTAFPAEPTTIRRYVTHLATSGHRVATIERKVAALSKAHRMQGLETPTRSGIVAEVLSGIRKRLAAPQKQATPFEPDDIMRIARHLPDTLRGKRDCAILTLGFVIGARSDDLSRLLVELVQEKAEGLLVTIPRGKTDQLGHGRLVGVPYQGDPLACPVRAVRAYLEASGLTQGPFFRRITTAGRLLDGSLSPEAIGDIIARTAREAGLRGNFTGHSLRAGFCTTAARLGKSEASIMAVTGHRSSDTLRRYIRRGAIWQNNAAAGLF